MENRERLASGTRGRWQVVGHDVWGVTVRSVDLDPAIDGVIDVRFVGPHEGFVEQTDFPRIGKELEAIVLGYTPSGQLRLSRTIEDFTRVDWSHAARDGPDNP